MSKWCGIGDDWISAGLRHYVTLDRKRQNGAEVLHIACAQSVAILRLQFVKGSTGNGNYAEQNEEEGLPHGGFVLHNIALPGCGTGRIVVGDAYFSSVATAIKLRQIKLKFIEIVQQCIRKYPMQFLRSQELEEEGGFASVFHEIATGEVYMLALV